MRCVRSSPTCSPCKTRHQTSYVTSQDGTIYMFGPEIPKRPDLQVSAIRGTETGIEVVIKNAGDANSTAIVVQAILAVGPDPASADWNTAAAALAGFQNPSGAFRYTDDQPEDNLVATVQAIPAIAGLPYPIAAEAGGDGTEVATPPAA